MEQLLTTFDSTVEMISVKCNILHLNAESKKLLEQVGIKGEGLYYSFPRFFDLRLTSDSICAFLERLSKNIEVCKEPENLVWVFLVDFISDFLLNEACSNKFEVFLSKSLQEIHISKENSKGLRMQTLGNTCEFYKVFERC